LTYFNKKFANLDNDKEKMRETLLKQVLALMKHMNVSVSTLNKSCDNASLVKDILESTNRMLLEEYKLQSKIFQLCIIGGNNQINS
jgi:hypothetical protein